ncbi:MAG: hypothetical protein AB8G23_12000 [Myxococcota bacterium]
MISKLRTSQMLILLLVSAFAVFSAVAASAQTPVAIQQQFFGSHGDGSSGPDSFPCCNQPVTSMTTGGGTITLVQPGTYDTRTTKGGLYQAEFRQKKQYGTAVVQPGGTVTVPSGLFTTNVTLMLVNPGGNLAALTTNLDRTVGENVFEPGGGIAADYIGPGAPNTITAAAPLNYFEYDAFANRATATPTFRTAGTWAGPNANQAGKIRVTPGVEQFGDTRNIIWSQLSTGFNIVTASTFADFLFPVVYGPGVGFDARFDYNFTPTSGTFPSNTFMASDVAFRETAEAGFVLRTAPTASAMTIFAGPGTGWFTHVGFTTGTVQVLANTIGTPTNDFSTRTEVGFNNLNTTSMGQITGQLQLVSGALLQSRTLGGEQSNLAHTTNTLIKFAPEPGSAALLGAGALGLIGLMIRDRRSGRA